jgi:hypothetical protein
VKRSGPKGLLALLLISLVLEAGGMVRILMPTRALNSSPLPAKERSAKAICAGLLAVNSVAIMGLAAAYQNKRSIPSL